MVLLGRRDDDLVGEVTSLVRRCQRGDDKAWSALVARYQNLVYSIPRRMGLGADDADDVFQATFLALYRTLDRLEEAAAVGKWLAVTAARESLRLKRVASRERTVATEQSTLEELVADEDVRSDSIAAEAETADGLRTLILSLPDNCRNLLAMLYLEDDVPYQTIAAKLGMPVGSIGPTRARCLDKLRRLLPEGFLDGVYQEPGPLTPMKEGK